MSIQIIDSSNDKNEDLIIFIDKAHQVSTVPRGWKRKLTNNNSIVYITPSQQLIFNEEQLQIYLSSESTCKCGLMCPFFIDELFNFDPQVQSVEGSIDETKLNCKHRYKNTNVNHDYQSINHQTANNTSPMLESAYAKSTNSTYNSNNQINNQTNNQISDQMNDQISDKLIVENSSTVNQQSSSNFPITIQSFLNYKPNDSNNQMVYGYIPIKKEILNNFSNLNILNQPIILTSPIKATASLNNSTNCTPQVLKILNPSPVIQSAQMVTIQQPNSS